MYSQPSLLHLTLNQEQAGLCPRTANVTCPKWQALAEHTCLPTSTTRRLRDVRASCMADVGAMQTAFAHTVSAYRPVNLEMSGPVHVNNLKRSGSALPACHAGSSTGTHRHASRSPMAAAGVTKTTLFQKRLVNVSACLLQPPRYRPPKFLKLQETLVKWASRPVSPCHLVQPRQKELLKADVLCPKLLVVVEQLFVDSTLTLRLVAVLDSYTGAAEAIKTTSSLATSANAHALKTMAPAGLRTSLKTEGTSSFLTGWCEGGGVLEGRRGGGTSVKRTWNSSTVVFS